MWRWAGTYRKTARNIGVDAYRISRNVNRSPISRTYHAADFENGKYDNQEEITFAVHNIGKKPLKAAKGGIRVTNSLGEKVIDVTFSDDNMGGFPQALRGQPRTFGT